MQLAIEDDHVFDKLEGEAGQDLFFAGLVDQLEDKKSDEGLL